MVNIFTRIIFCYNLNFFIIIKPINLIISYLFYIIYTVHFIIDLNSYLSHSRASVDHPDFLSFTSTTQNMDNISFIVDSSLDIRVVGQSIFVVCIILSFITSTRPAMNQSRTKFCNEGDSSDSFNLSANNRSENRFASISASMFPGFQNSGSANDRLDGI